jgi:Zn-dependent protease with chaperone function
VIYDTLMEKSSPAEVEAVLAHELGHWYFCEWFAVECLERFELFERCRGLERCIRGKRPERRYGFAVVWSRGGMDPRTPMSRSLTAVAHPTKLLLIAQFHLLFTFTLFHIFIHNRSLFSSFDFPSSLAVAGPNGSPSSQPIIIGFMLFQMVLEPLDTVVKFLMNKQTRKYEYQADEFAVRLDKTQELKDALIKLHVDNLSSPHNDPIYSAYHHSHPTLPERLRAMDEFKPGPGLKLKGEKKEL